MRPWAKCSYLSMLIVRPSRRRSFEGSMIITLVSLHNRWSLTFACLDICILRVFVVNIIINCTNLPQCTKITQKVSHLFSTINSFQSEICFPIRENIFQLDNSWKNIHSENDFIVGERNKLFHSFIIFLSENWYSTCLRWLGQQKTKRSQQYHQKQPHLPTFDPLMTSDFKNGGDFINS